MSGSQAKHWQFTLNNYTEAHEDELSTLGSSPDVNYLIYGKEVGDSGTPHLQGHVSFVARRRFGKVKELLPEGAHLEMVRLLQRHIEYCRKDGNYREFGTPPAVQGGARSEFDEFRTTISGGVYDSPELREKHPNIMARYPHYARAVVRDLFPQPLGPSDFCPRPWQQRVVDYVDSPIHPREILFVVDEPGNAGKTYLGRFLLRTREKVQIIRAGKTADMALCYKITTKLLIVDVPREKTEHLQYAFLEQVKDGILSSPKYQSETKMFPTPHVLVFMNESPSETALSADRYRIIKPF